MYDSCDYLSWTQPHRAFSAEFLYTILKAASTTLKVVTHLEMDLLMLNRRDLIHPQHLCLLGISAQSEESVHA